jgi:hypothetical protein
MVSRRIEILMLIVALSLALMADAQGQGSVFGTLENHDGSIPAVGEIGFFGYIDNTDDEIRTESVVGAGYDSGNWFDDFQNYQNEAPGLPYDYHFYNLNNNEGAILSDLIPDNSFQQEDLVLGAATWPAAPVGLRVLVRTESSLTLAWDDLPGLSYHVYRRTVSSDGSFFRRDDPGGSLADPGVAGGEFVDTGIVADQEYDYLLIAENAVGILGTHSVVLDTGEEPYFCGDADASGSLNVTDAVYLIQYIFASGPAPQPLLAGDADCSVSINVSDAVYLIQYIFAGGPEPCLECS